MTSVLAVLVFAEPPPPDEDEVDDEHAPTPAVIRPAAARAMSFLELRWLMLIFTFPGHYAEYLA
jgi:hypothetical protein